VWQRVAKRLALTAPRDGRDDARAWVAQEQPRELASGVAGDADDRDLGSHRKIMHVGGYLCNSRA